MNASARQNRGADEQRRGSLDRANAVRSARAGLKRELAAGDVEIREVIARPPGFAAQAKVYDLLLAVPGLGPARTATLLTRCQIPHRKSLVNLSERQRGALITLLG